MFESRLDDKERAITVKRNLARLVRHLGERTLKTEGGHNEVVTEVQQLRFVVAQLLDRHHQTIKLPPEELRLHVGTRTTAANFLAQGGNSSRAVLSFFGKAPEGPVLDWGCGPGRTLRWLWEFPAWRIHYRGCDVDAEAINWLQSQGISSVAVCDPEPPLPYEDQSFSGLFAFSVLTHIHPSKHRDWYAEIRRVLKPGGRAYLTANGVGVARRLPRRVTAEFERTGFFYMKHKGHYKDAAAVSEVFTRNALNGILQLTDFQESGYQNMDAFSVVRPL